MASHAYVRYEDDKRFAIVSVSDILSFNPEETNFASNVYWVKWTGDEDGEEDFYRARILIVGGKQGALSLPSSSAYVYCAVRLIYYYF